MVLWRGYLLHAILVLTQPVYLATRYLLDPEYFAATSSRWHAVTAITWIFILTRVTIPFVTSPLLRLPSPNTDIFPIGHFRPIRSPPTDLLTKMLVEVPNDGIIALWGFYLHPELIITKPDAIMEVLNTRSYDWEKPPLAKKLLARVLGDGLINVEGNVHKAMRKSVAPAFAGRQIRDLVPLMYGKGLAFADAMAREAKSSATGALEMMHQMSRVTLDIIGAAGVGKDFNTIENDDDPLAKLYATITDTNRGPLLVFFLINVLLPSWIVKRFRGTVYGRVAVAQEQLRHDVRAIMAEKKQAMREKSLEQKDIISTIMHSGDFPDDYLVDQLLTFLAAGHDTTASALTWTTWRLCLDTSIQDRLRAECNEHLAGKNFDDIDASTFDDMPYLTAVCNETLRTYPTVPATSRIAAKDTMIGDQPIPKGTTIIIAPWPINRLPSLWGADADQFNPDRWLNGPDAALGGAQTPYAMITFLHGPRSCIGQAFARTEMKCILAAFVMRFRFEMLDPTEKIEVGGFVTIKPRNGLRLKLHDLKAKA